MWFCFTKGHSGDGSILFKYERSGAHLFVLSWARVRCLCKCFWCSLCCCMLFVSYVWVLFVVLCCDVVGMWVVVIFVLSEMRVVGGVPLWVECVFRRVDVVCLCLLYTQLLL